MDRSELATTIAAGLAGSMQMRHAEGVADQYGEDAARLVLIQIVRGQAQWRTAVSQKPLSWSDVGKQRVDVALLPWRDDPKTWYGVIEFKWPGESLATSEVRKKLVEDVVRAVSVETNNLNAKLLVLGCRNQVEQTLFDIEHRDQRPEDERKAFSKLLTRTPGETGTLPKAELEKVFPAYGSRVPGGGTVNHALEATLLASSEARVGSLLVGRVFVWQCSARAGRVAGGVGGGAPQPPPSPTA